LGIDQCLLLDDFSPKFKHKPAPPAPPASAASLRKLGQDSPRTLQINSLKKPKLIKTQPNC
jgi:hypothetical protein